MAPVNQPRPRAAKLPRSANVAVRLDMKLKYSAELAARAQNRSLSSFLEWAVAQAGDSVQVRMVGKTIGDVVAETWSPEPADRLLNLALKYPHLLSFEQELILRAIQQSPFLSPRTGTRTSATCNRPRVRLLWPTLEK